MFMNQVVGLGFNLCCGTCFYPTESQFYPAQFFLKIALSQTFVLNINNGCLHLAFVVRRAVYFPPAQSALLLVFCVKCLLLGVRLQIAV